MTPAELRQEIRAIGDEFSFEVITKCRELYQPLHDAAAKVPVSVARDEKYGPDERHRLDVFRSEAKSEQNRPVLIFMHGGGFVAGDKTPAGNLRLRQYRHLGGAERFHRGQHDLPAGARPIRGPPARRMSRRLSNGSIAISPISAAIRARFF